MLAFDQSRTPPGRSIRFTSSPVNGAYFARQAQKSSASLSRESASDWPLADRASELSKSTAQRFFTAVSI
jgi:hypothetical protein